MKTQAETNHCAVCKAPISPDKLMCRTHWRLVPVPVQQEVMRTWRAMRGAGAMGGSAATANRGAFYLRARGSAITAVRTQLAQAKQETPAGETHAEQT